MNEQDVAARIARRLDDSVDELPPEVLQRLQAARETALARMPAASEGATPSEGEMPSRRPAASWWRLSVPALAILILAVGYLAFRLMGESPDQAIHELEAEMLDHALPPHAFQDEGFQEWLKRNPKP